MTERPADAAQPQPLVAPRALHARLADRAGRTPLLVDLRPAEAFAVGHIDGAVNVPVGELPGRASELPRNTAIAVICEGGFRSSLASSLLQRAGVDDIINVTGGMAAFRAVELTR